MHTIIISCKDNVVDGKSVQNVIKKKTLEGTRRNGTPVTVDRSQEQDIAEAETTGGYKNMTLEEAIGNHEKAIIVDALKRYGTTRKAAEALNISQSQLMRKKKKYEIV